LPTPVHTGESERQARYNKAKARSLAREASSMPKITNFFQSLQLQPKATEDNGDKVEETRKDVDWEALRESLEQYQRDNVGLCPRTVNRITHLKGYMSLRASGYGAMNASEIIAKTVNRGCHYAQVIRGYATDFAKKGTLPHFRQGLNTKVKSLLKDEYIKASVDTYLKNNKFTATPDKLKRHLEEEIFPKMDPSKILTISSETARKWMHQMGWRHQIYKKGIYIDGHEREDVVAYRKEFLSQMGEWQKYMVDYDEETLEPIPNPYIGNGIKQHILVTHDESTFNANDDTNRGWMPQGEQPLRKKSRGKGLMVSEFLLETVGRLAVPEEMYRDIQDPTFPREACEIFEFGGKNGYWDGENVVKQVSIAHLKFLSEVLIFFFYHIAQGKGDSHF
jgi:hypothetical protein